VGWLCHGAKIGRGAFGLLARALVKLRDMVIAREVVAACPCTLRMWMTIFDDCTLHVMNFDQVD
jgi:hypothetical protein